MQVKAVFKKVSFITIFSLIFLSSVYAQTGVGIFPAKIEIEAPFLKNTFTDVTIFNPSQRELKLKVEVYCKNCERDVKFFENKIGTLTYDLDVKAFPETITLQPMMEQRIMVKFPNSLLLKGIFKTTIFGREVGIPVYLFHFDEERFDYRVVASTVSTPIEISLVSGISLKFLGMSKIYFMLAILVLLLIASFVYYIYNKKIYEKYEKF
jgi:hypothetical protein